MKFTATLTFQRTYEVKPENYGTSDIQQMINIDKQNIDDDPMMFFDIDTDIVELSVEIASEDAPS